MVANQPETNEEIVEKLIVLANNYELFDGLDMSNEFLSAWHNFLSSKTVDSLIKVPDAITIDDYVVLYDYFLSNGSYKVAADLALFAYHTNTIPNRLGEILRSYALTENAIFNKPHSESSIAERDYVKYLFDKMYCFHDIDFIQREYEVPGIGKIDILGKQIITDRPVVIECKLDNKNPNKQLIAYGSHFDNPILIGITEEPIPKKMQLPNINYLTYYEMGIRIKGHDYDTDQPPVYGIFNEETGWR